MTKNSSGAWAPLPWPRPNWPARLAQRIAGEDEARPRAGAARIERPVHVAAGEHRLLGADHRAVLGGLGRIVAAGHVDLDVAEAARWRDGRAAWAGRRRRSCSAPAADRAWRRRAPAGWSCRPARYSRRPAPRCSPSAARRAARAIPATADRRSSASRRAARLTSSSLRVRAHSRRSAPARASVSGRTCSNQPSIAGRLP